MKKYLIKTYGCQMNVHESEKLSGMLEGLGYISTEDITDADIIVFNTCCIRDGVEHKIFANVGMLQKIVAKKPNLIVAICGCMAQNEGKAEAFIKRYPFVNIVFGTHNLNEFGEYVKNYEKTHKTICEVWDKEKEIDENTPMNRTSGLNAWVNIMYGCNNFCTYCIVPYVRGRERSRKKSEIIEEVKELVQQGYKIITLLGQNVNSYGNDCQEGSFAELLSDLCKIEGDFRIKFMTSHPKDLTDECIALIGKEKKLSKAVHLPVQSGSNKVLETMNRKYTAEHYLNVVQKMKKQIPNLALSTDIIVGFPGETEEDFQDTYNLVKKVRYNGVFAFMYSRRKGTLADKMDNQIPLNVKRERVNKLLALSKGIAAEHNQELIGSIQDCLIIEQGLEGYYGQIDCGKNIFIETNEKIKLETYHDVRIIKYEDKKLYGEIIKEK